MARTGRRRAEVRRSRAPLVLGLVALLAAGVTVAATAVVGPLDPGGDPEAPASGSATPAGEVPETGSASPSEASPTPVDVDIGDLPVPRTLDCSVLDGDPVRQALGAPVTLRQGYASGDRVEVAPGVTDVVAEDGCVFGSPLAEARVWVFAAPVRTAYARSLVREARRTPGCSPRTDETGFGDPTLTDVCATRAPRSTSATLRGLFGDSWLTCRLSVQDEPPDEVLARARRWCAEVATALAARP